MRSLPLILSILAAITGFLQAAPPAAPSDLTVVATSATTLRLEWVDHSTNESGFEVSYRVGTSGNFLVLNYYNPNTTFLNLNGAASTTYQIRVRSFLLPGPEFSAYAGPAEATTPPPVVTNSGFRAGKVQQAFSFNLSSSIPTAVTGYSISALPAGLSLNPATGAITGTPTTAGRVTGQVTITHNGLADATALLKLEIFINPPALLAPALANSPGNLSLAPGGSQVVLPMANTFTDPDVTQAARLTTDLGTIDFAFYSSTAPQTVANFLGYLNREDFLNTIFHRSVPGFIIQGGAFRADATASAVTTLPPVVNEPRISNLLGTVAMAKVTGNPNSATNQFFISLANNSANLDNQNEGFTVFARVAGNGMSVANAISALPLQNYSSTHSALSSTPVRISPAPTGPVPYDPANLVRISSAIVIPPLSLAVQSSFPAVATATLSGTDLLINPLNPGATTITLTATDLDGQSTGTSFQVAVGPDTYELWATRQSFAFPADATENADPDLDGKINLIEFALASPPLSPSPGCLDPTILGNHLTCSFTLRRFLSGTSVTLESAPSPAGPWTTRWNPSDGFTHPWILSHSDSSDSTLVIARDPDPATAPRNFLRLRITKP